MRSDRGCLDMAARGACLGASSGELPNIPQVPIPRREVAGGGNLRPLRSRRRSSILNVPLTVAALSNSTAQYSPMPVRTPHYARRCRKRAGLSQDEVARLLGTKCGTKVSRYERFARLPTLATAFAYEVLFGVPASELFAGVFASVRTATLARARGLLKELRNTRGLSHRGRRAWLEQIEREVHKLRIA